MLVVGSRFLAPALSWGRGDTVQVVRIDVDPVQINKPRPAGIAITGHAGPALAALAAELGSGTGPDRGAWLDGVRAGVAASLAALEPQAGFARAIREAVAEDGIIVTDVTQVATFLQYGMPVQLPRTLLTPGYQGTLGWAYPAALGAKVALPSRQVVSISGDGGFMFNIQELSTAMAHGIAVVAVVFSDGAFGNVKRIQRDSFGGRHIGVELHNPDFVALARSFGMNAVRAETANELGAALRRALASGGPALIEVPVGEMPSIWTLIRRPPSQGPAPSGG